MLTWSRRARQKDDPERRRQYVREKLAETLEPHTNITHQLLFEATRLHSLQMSRIYALRWAQAFPGQYPPGLRVGKMPPPPTNESDRLVRHASVVLIALSSQYEAPPTEAELAAEMLRLYTAKWNEKREEPAHSTVSESSDSHSDSSTTAS